MLPSRESSIQEIIRHICINQEKLTFIFSSLLDESDYINLLKSFCASSPPKIFQTTKVYPNDVYFQYSANILLNKENIEEGIDLQSYYVYELKKLGKLWSGELFQALTNNSSSFPLARLSFNLNFLLKKKMPLYRSIKSLFWELLHKFQNADLVRSFGMTIFEMDDQVDIDILSSYDIIKNVTNSNISTFLQIPAILTTEKSSKLIQSLLTCSEPFPGYSKLFKEPNILTLINDSLVKRTHFIENIIKVGLSYNCNLTKLISLTESCCCSDFLPFYFIISDGQITEQPIEELSKLDDSHAFHIFKRIHGDRRMIDFFRINLGKSIPTDKLADESFVSLSKPILFENIDTETIISLSNQYYYTITDKDRDIDFDFYFGMRVITLILNNNYTYRNKESNNDYFNNYHRIREIKSYLSQIKNKKIIIEIFSALFIKNYKTNKFVCPFDVAEAVISYISSSFSPPENESSSAENDSTDDDKSIVHHFESENDYDRICADIFARALIHLKLGKLLITTKTRRKKNTELISASSSGKIDSTSIEPCLMTPNDIISQLLTRGEFEKASDAANDISSKLPHLGAICEIARAVQMTKKFNYSPVLSVGSRKIYNIEYCMSNNIDSDYVLTKCIESDEEADKNEINAKLKEIIIKRKGKDLNELFAPIQKVSSSLLSNHLFEDGKINPDIIDSIEENMTEVYNDILEESNKKVPSDCHLTKFLNFVKKFDVHFEKFEVEELIDAIFAKTESWSEVEEVFGENCLNGILPIVNNLRNKEKLIKLVGQKSRILSLLLCSILNITFKAQSKEIISDNSNILNNFYLKNTKQKEYKYPDLTLPKKEIKHRNILDIIYPENEEETNNKKEFDKENIFDIQINDDQIEEFTSVKSSIQSILEKDYNDNQTEKINQLIDFRLMNDDLFIFRCIGIIMDKISFHDFLDVFPEFRTIEFETINSAISSPEIVLDKLINDERVSTAINFSSTFNSRNLLISKLVRKVEELKQTNEKKVTVFLNLWNELSSEIFERLPKKSYMNINSQIEILRNENTAINEKHPELPVLEQYPYLNFDNDLLRIFDSRISKGMEEDEFYVNYFKHSDDEMIDDLEPNNESSSYFYYHMSIKHNDVFNVIDEYANIYLPHFKSNSIIVQKLGSILFNIIDSIVVRSNQGEQIAIKILEKVLYLLKSIKFQLIKILNNSLNSSNSLNKNNSSLSNANNSMSIPTSVSASAPMRRGSITSTNENDLISMASFPFEREIKLIECLHQFSELTVYNHFDIEYTFSNFQNKNITKNRQPFPLKFFIFVCDKLDFTDLLQKFATLWEIDITELQITRIENCYKLGQFSSTIHLIKNLSQTASTSTFSAVNSSSFTTSSSNKASSIPNDLREKLRERLEKAVFFDVGDSIVKEKIDKIKNYNADEDIDIELEVEEYLSLKNNYKKIDELMKNIKTKIGHNRNSPLRKSSSDLLKSDTQNLLMNRSISRSRSSINQRLKLNINLLSNEKVVKLEDMIEISKSKTNNDQYNYPFFDEAVLKEFVSSFYVPNDKIWINSIYGNFSESFQIFFSDLPKSQRVVQVVLIQIFFSALNTFKYDDLFAYLSNVKHLKLKDDFNKLLFTDVSNSLRKMKMFTVLSDFLERLSQFEGIITNMIDIIDEDKSWDDLLRHLNILVDTIQKELSRRLTEKAHNKNEDDDDDISNDKNKNYVYSDNELKLLLSKVGVLNNFTRLCIDQDISYPSKYAPNLPRNQNIFKIKNLSILRVKNDHASYASLLATVEEMAVISLYYEKFNLAFQIIEIAKSRPSNNSQSINMLNETTSPDSFTLDQSSFILFKICDTLVDKLNMTHRPLAPYFEKMHQRLDSNSYAMLSLALSKVIFGKAVSTQDVPIFIERNVHGMKLQANILMELGLLNDALKVVIKANDAGLVKKLEKQASVYGNAAVRSRCQRFLELKL